MSTELIFCPACNHKLRVPSDLMGQRVQCPKCNTEFTAPPRTSAPEGGDDRFFAEPRPRSEGDSDRLRSQPLDDWEDPQRQGPRLAGKGVILAPAIALIVIGFFALLGNAYTLFSVLANPAGFRQQMQQIQAMFPAGGGAMPFDPVEMVKVTSIVFMVISLLQMIGGVCMAQRRGYPIAIIGAVLAIMNCNNALICIPSFGIGIWAMVVLFMPTVRAHFSQPAA